MLLKPDKKSKQFSRNLVPEVIVELQEGQEDQLEVLKRNVEDLKKKFSDGIAESRLMGPLMMKSEAVGM